MKRLIKKTFVSCAFILSLGVMTSERAASAAYVPCIISDEALNVEEEARAISEPKSEAPLGTLNHEGTVNVTEISNSSDLIVFKEPELMAEFPGGTNGLMMWLSENIRYPENAQKNNIQGKVVVRFIVEKDGSIRNAEIVRGVDQDLDEEALRVVKLMPKWNPGKYKGEPVASYFYLPINFNLQ